MYTCAPAVVVTALATVTVTSVNFEFRLALQSLQSLHVQSEPSSLAGSSLVFKPRLRV